MFHEYRFFRNFGSFTKLRNSRKSSIIFAKNENRLVASFAKFSRNEISSKTLVGRRPGWRAEGEGMGGQQDRQKDRWGAKEAGGLGEGRKILTFISSNPLEEQLCLTNLPACCTSEDEWKWFIAI
jgi:hypothetical protein